MARLGAPLLVVALSVCGCLGGAAHGQQTVTGHGSAQGVLTVTVRAAALCPPFVDNCPGAPAQQHRYTLTCSPDGGTMPHPARACSALRDYLRPAGDRLVVCRGAAIPSASATLVGRFHHRRVALQITTWSWCHRSMRVMRDLWALSAFPCTTVVIHTQRIEPYARFAARSGCPMAHS
jgi:hypothetical protein